jgi:hypothetical protein
MGELYAVDLILFVFATFAAAFVAGLAGFAFAIVAAAVWLHFLPPALCTALIAAFGLIVQGWSVWKLRQSIKPARLAPFLIGGVIGVPIVCLRIVRSRKEGPRVRRLTAGGKRIRTAGPPIRESFFARPPRNSATTNRPVARAGF